MSHVAPSFFSDYHHRFFFLHGKTDDEFCHLPSGILNIEELLHQHLQSIGYECILFFNGKQKLYCYDIQSKWLIRRDGSGQANRAGSSGGNQAQTQPSASPSPGRRRKSKMCAGPLGMSKVRRRDENAGANNAPAAPAETSPQPSSDDDEPLHFGGMNDMMAANTLNRCMRDGSVKTAVVLSDGLDFINFTDGNAVRIMADNLPEWSGLFAENENICVFILPDFSVSDIQNFMERHTPWQFLRTRMFAGEGRPSDQMLYIGPPRRDEVESLLHRARLTRNLQTDWRALDEAALQITRNLCGGGETLKSLNVRLRQVQALDAPTLERLAGQTGQPSAMDRLRNTRGWETVAEKIDRFVAVQTEAMEEAAESASASSPAAPATGFSVERILPPPPKKETGPNLHLALTGNPGTGKTTIARLLGEIFREAGLLELGHMVKASRDDLVAGYIGQTALQTAEKVQEAMGGVLFIDEAYRLSEGGERDFGTEAVETVMEAMSNHMGEFSAVIAGYPEPIQRFLDANPGLRRRFGNNVIHIPDYEPELLHHIFIAQVQRNNRRLAKRLETLLPDFFHNWFAARDPEHFGNAGDVISLYETMDANRAYRTSGADMEREERKVLTPEDLPEEMKEHLRKRKAATVEEALARLDDLVGLESVKEWLRKLTHRMRLLQEEQRRGLETEPPFPGHYVFSGRPGTGKTTVARVLGEVFQILGLLGRSQVHEVVPGDLIDKYVGGTEEKCAAVYKKALNGVLFIDEAHQLADGGDNAPGRIAVRQLVPFMLNNRENLCVVMAGYPEEMERLLELDPGLKSRFNPTVVFEDFSAEELLAVFDGILEKRGEIAAPGLRDELRRLFEVWAVDKKADFGNARDVNNLVERMRENRADRLAECDVSECTDADLRTFAAADIPEAEKRRMGKKVDRLEDVLAELDQLIGLEGVKRTVRTLINRLKVEKLRGGEGNLAPGHYLFTGNPGTGKTTVARLMGEMFRALGLLKKGHLVETGRSDLVAGYQGQTALKTREVLESSLDGVLFIDEAYQLVESDRDSFGKEALETLVAFMENHRDRLCIIAAGYPEPMRRFVARNPGLPSRFSAEILFENYGAEEMVEIFQLMAGRQNMTLADGLPEALRETFGRMAAGAGDTFGNGREVRKLLDAMLSRQADRLAEAESVEPEGLYRLEIQDLPG
ncbi:MAG: AAA family ATPase [Desulfococcaceae bacterium]